MCGIFGILNYGNPKTRSEILKVLIAGLKRLEYRGYDSAGISIDSAEKKPMIYRVSGPIDALDKALEKEKLDTCLLDNHVGIAHTRWATHGEPCERNSHPHSSDKSNEFVVVHNGIITNYSTIKTMLINKGFVFESDTDTEVIPKLAKFIYDQDKTLTFQEVILEVTKILQGSLALLVKSRHFPGEAIAVKRGSPLIVGVKFFESEKKKNFLVKQMNTDHYLRKSQDRINLKEYIQVSEGELPNDKVIIFSRLM